MSVKGLAGRTLSVSELGKQVKEVLRERHWLIAVKGSPKGYPKETGDVI